MHGMTDHRPTGTHLMQDWSGLASSELVLIALNRLFSFVGENPVACIEWDTPILNQQIDEFEAS